MSLAKLARFVTPVNSSTVATYLAVLIRLYAAVLLPPLLVALLAGDRIEAALFTAIALLALLLSLPVKLADIPDLSRREALVVIGIAYLAFAVLGAVPFLGRAGPVDALFEAMSGFTTTGLTVMHEEALPLSLLFFRCYSQWVGGAGIAVLGLVFLLHPGQAAFQLYSSAFVEKKLVGSVVRTAWVVSTVYAGLTLAAFGTYLAAGMPAFDSLLHALSTISTGGFSSRAESVGGYGSIPLAAAVAVFMLLGATSFPLFYHAFARRRGLRPFVDDLQLRYLIGAVGVAALIAALTAGPSLDGMTEAIFHATSAFTTTGFTLSNPASWSSEQRWIVVVAMIIGGSTGSTAGGIKIMRFIILTRLAGWLVFRRSLPEEAKIPIEYGSVSIAGAELMELFAFVGLYGATLVVSTGVLIATGFGMGTALFESASALGTVGLSMGVTSAALPAWGKLMLIVDMWAGRLEIVPLLLVLNPLTWRPVRRGT